MKKVLSLIMSFLIVFSAMTGLTVAADTAIAYPEMNNTYSLKTKLDYELNYKGGNIWETLRYLSNAPVDMSKGWLEFDVYVESADATAVFQLCVRDVDEKTKLAGVGDIESNKWTHKVIPVANFSYGDADMSKVIGFYLDGINSDNTYVITNMAITTLHEINYTHSLKTELDYELNNYRGDLWGSQQAVYRNQAIDMSNGYLEFDVFVESADATVDFSITGSDEYGNYVGSISSGTMETNKWVHKVIHLGFGTLIKFFRIEPVKADNTYTITNVAITGYPEMNNTHHLKTKLDYELNNYRGDLWGSQQAVYRNQAIDMSNGYLEFDVFVESADATVDFSITGSDEYGNYVGSISSGTMETNKWVHKVIHLGFGTLIKFFRIEGLKADTTYTITNVAVTGYPEMNNTHSLKTKLAYELNSYRGTDIWATNMPVSAEAVDMSNGYLEFDVFIESAEATVDFSITGSDAAGNYIGSISSGTIETNKWVHKVINLGFGSLIKYFRIEPLKADTTYNITNMAVTGYPEMNNTHYLGLDLETNHSCFKDFNTATNFGTGVTDFTKYDYLEFDLFANGGTETTQRLYFNNEGGMGVYDVKVTPNKWVHVVISVNDLKNNDGYFGGDASKYSSIVLEYANMESGVTYLIRNMALTNEEEPFETGDANHDGAVGIEDLVWMKKCAAEIEGYDYRASADFNDDNIVNGDDLIYIRKLLLGTL